MVQDDGMEFLSVGACQPIVTLTATERENIIAIRRPTATGAVSTDSPGNISRGMVPIHALFDALGPSKKTKKKRRGAVLVEEQPRDVKKVKSAIKVQRREWTVEESTALLDGVEKHGRDWNKIKAESGDRLGKRSAYSLYLQLYQHYPDKNRELIEAQPPRPSAWTAEEKTMLLEGVGKHGLDFD
ncbi:hypothetical protein TrLO_g5103 [Triparma laevis f. longispina]|uniref:Myb-like domain-containing protein n=1 Tax=Triparma laevis f. longispina TaxID=1714387 RepID=A0A9W6ZRL4_9STRA|nr:hypothetical protein TrLO_g5103 [Triparma laevis f. longispina]